MTRIALSSLLSGNNSDQALREVAAVLVGQYPGKFRHLLKLVSTQANSRLDAGDDQGFRIWKRLSVAIVALSAPAG